MKFAVIVIAVIVIVIVLLFKLDMSNTSIYIDPNCANISKNELISQFNNASFLREAMNRANLDTDYPINDATAPLIASHFVKLDQHVSGNCTFR